MTPARIEELAHEAHPLMPNYAIDAIRAAVREALTAAAELCDQPEYDAAARDCMVAIRRLRDELTPSDARPPS